MNKDNYNIDDILSEVRKRREEAPREEKTEAPNIIKTSEVPKEELPEPQPEPEPEPQPEPEPKPEPQPVQKEAEPEVQEEPEEEMVDILKFTEEAEAPAAQEVLTQAPKEEIINTVEAEEEEPPKKKGRKTKIILGIIAIIVVVAIAAGAIFADNMINRLVKSNSETVATTEAPWKGMDKLIENFSPIDETEATQLSSLKDMIKTWYYNGTPCSSTHVLNVLFIGEDTRGSEILDEGTNADSAIIVSINIDTGVITLTSILRDAYTYWETTEGDPSTGRFGKINGAMATGDINAYINCVENMYKVKIDNYAIVNFDSFETIVDTLGGVTLELTEAEIEEINSHQKRYGKVTIEKTFEGKKGKLKLNGKQALAYCRIRKLDSDNMRADRQKTCIIELFKQTKDASPVTLLKIINRLTPYVKTNFSKNEVVKIAKYALSQGWLNFDFYMQTIPEHNLWGGTAYGAWVWKCDFPVDAYNLQSIVYGKSSITLAHKRVDTSKCPESGFYSDGDGAMGSYYTITNEHYGEVTNVTTSTTTKKSQESD